MLQSMNLKGKVVVITGGNSGIGRATALVFAREEAKVVIAARNVERGNRVLDELHIAGADALFVRTDVSKSSQIEALVNKTVETFGRLDCAVNNAAGQIGACSLTADFSEQEFDETMAVDLKGVWLGMKFQIRQMLRQNPSGGAIVNVSSVNGLGGAPTASLYSAAKAGILGLTKSAALEYIRHGIRINAIAAGPFDTPLLNFSFDREANGDPDVRKSIEDEYIETIPIGRIGNPTEAAEVIAWLCSDAASYVIGHSMIVDGGMSAPFR
ncbi:MAG: glucose 1-dehydrogenase [Methanomassiliicoccales archaeon]|jgi:NAD(P)-dependent dehydrogenase (short-subunit alcohol dehydrogenase family)